MLTDKDTIAWAAYHASHKPPMGDPPALRALLPLFDEKICHSSNGSEVARVKTMCKQSPTFVYWDFILRQETLILIFVRPHRGKKIALYVEVLEKLTPLFFAPGSCELFKVDACSHS